MHLRHIHPVVHRHLGRRGHIILSLMLRDFAFGMADLFVPVILLVEGYALYWVGLFFVIQTIIRILTQLAMPEILSRLGVQNTLRASFFLGVAYIAGLNFIGVSESVVIGTAIYSGIMQTLYWDARHIDTIDVISKAKSVRDISAIEIGSTLMRMTAPFIGGVIAEYISTQALFGVAFGILVSASLVVAQEARKERHRRTPKPDLKSAFDGKLTNPLIANFGMNFQSELSSYIWPLFMYLTIQNLGAVGGILSIGNFLYLGLVYKTGKAKERVWHFFAGISGRILSYVLRIITATPLGVVVADFTGAASHGVWTPLYMDEYYAQAKKGDVRANVIAMELIGDTGKLALWSLFTLLALTYDLDDAFDFIFLAGIPMVGITILMLRDRSLTK